MEDSPYDGVLDALMYLTKSDSKFIWARAFSTLSILSTYASGSEDENPI